MKTTRGYLLVPGMLFAMTALLPNTDEGTTRASLWDVPVTTVCGSICTECPTEGHATVEGSEDEHELHEKPLDCYGGDCGSHPCGLTLRDPEGDPGGSTADKLIDAVRAGAVAEVATLIQRHPAEIVPVPERGAIQVLGCADEVIVHIPFGSAAVTTE